MEIRFLKKINSKARTEANTGFGINAESYGGRFLNKDGAANVQKTGIGPLDGISWFHTMLEMPVWKFLAIIMAFYFGINVIFAEIYFTIGVEHLNGITAASDWDKFWQAFFFSIQTYTTVGYGHISPSGFLASFVAAVEALIGLLSFAIATGLLYGRFSKPKAYLRFSENALIAPYQNNLALMLRLTPFKNTNLVEAEALLTLAMVVEEEGKLVNKFFNLELEMAKVNNLTLSWTLVHPVTEDSPLYNLSQEDYNNIKGEIMVFIKVFDDMFSTHVIKRTSYVFSEVQYGAKFNPMFFSSHEHHKTILHIDKLNSFEKVSLENETR